MSAVMSALRQMRESLYTEIREITNTKVKENTEKKFIALYQKPYKNNEMPYQKFLRR